jgi:chemosensory pili system protein ChpB (putative protein-glutamate methylesterase)
VWILAASTGGIGAVAEFLRRVPPENDLALVYVQHIFAEQHRQLLHIVERNSGWPARGVDYGATLKGGWVTIPSAEERFDIDSEGLMGIAEGDGWQPPYRPNIDEVAEQIGRHYRQRAGMIVFTGMGNDGARGAELIRRKGGEVWVQSPATCAATAMPEAVLAKVTDAVTGSVAELADKFNSFNNEINAGSALAHRGR